MMVSSHLSQIIFGAGFYKCLQTGLIIDTCFNFQLTQTNRTISFQLPWLSLVREQLGITLVLKVMRF
jgi:hypothetical protein